MNKENMKLWKAVEKTNPKYTKQVGFGRKFTSVNAQYQIMCATEQFGAIGKGWGIKDEFFNPIIEGLIGYTATLWWKDADGENYYHINSSIATHNKSGKLDDECFKKVSTDALTKGLSKLGFNADVFLGQYDDNRYVNQMKQEFSEKPDKKDKHAPGTKMTAEVFGLMQEAISQGKGDKVRERMNDYIMTKVQEEKLTTALHKFFTKVKKEESKKESTMKVDTLRKELELSDDENYYSDTTHVTNSMLSLLNKSPQHLQMYLNGVKQETPALNFGKAFHTIVLEPQKVDKEIAIFDGKSRRGKVWEEFQDNNKSKTIITESEYNKILLMRKELVTPTETWDYIEESEHEVVRVWEMANHTEKGGVIKCKGKVDCIYTRPVGSDNPKVLIDVKTTQDCSPESFRRTAYRYGYHRQAAFYLYGFEADEFWFAVVEKEAPYRTALYKASDEFIEKGRQEISDLLNTYNEYFINKEKNVKEYYFKGEI